ncbi:MAG: hypothetical protein HOV67_09460 [Kribbellaceae bacterium]|nr:hypothetical protein [Kribbellaceae bacterium]
MCERLAGQERRGAGIEGLREACASGRIAVRWDTTSLYAREVPRPAIDVHEARLELCRRHVRYFGPTSPKAFAWWSGLSPADARAVWDQLAGELLEVDFDGAPGWVLRTEEHHVAPPRGVRLLAAPDLRLFGRDSGARFIAPGLRRLTPVADSFHPNGVLADGRIVGAWGRKGGRVDVILAEHLTPEQYEALQAEVTTMPVPDPELRVQVVGGQSGACHSPVPAVRTSRTTPAAARSTKAKPPRRRPSS